MATFDLFSFRFTFLARDPICLPAGLPGNILRGGLGSALRRIACAAECPGHAGADIRECQLRSGCAYARIFEPASLGGGPSGLSDWPRPFVLRAAHLSRQPIAAAGQFWFDINLFEMRRPVIEFLERAFRSLAVEGFGPQHSQADLLSVHSIGPDGSPADGRPISISLDPGADETHRLRVVFRTPTELKSDQMPAGRPEFGILFARARDRIATLRSLYGDGPLEIDFHALGKRAEAVQMTECQVRQRAVQRRSARTGHSHTIGGFVGMAEYQGNLGEFLPILKAAQWTGVGRHCVWGNGELRIDAFPA